jgi:phosphoribosylanthranilate isomerase
MTWVKLCGMTRAQDVVAAVEAGADAVGFVLAPESLRRVSVEQAAGLGAGVGIARYLVTVDLPPEELLEAAAAAAVDGVQPHGEYRDEAAVAALDAGLAVLYPVAVSGPVDLAGIPEAAVPILDTRVPGSHGGTGRSFDWTVASGAGRPLVLAGGLTPENVREARAAAEPWGVDVSTGIESSPGIKDREKMRRFVEAARW